MKSLPHDPQVAQLEDMQLPQVGAVPAIALDSPLLLLEKEAKIESIRFAGC